MFFSISLHCNSYLNTNIFQKTEFKQLMFRGWQSLSMNHECLDDILNLAMKILTIMDDTDHSPVAIQCL